MRLFAVLMNISYAMATIYKAVDQVSKSTKEIILEVEVPSLLTCAHKCRRNNAKVNYDLPICRCIIFKNKTTSKDDNTMDDTTLSGMFYEVNEVIGTTAEIKPRNTKDCSLGTCMGYSIHGHI